MNHYVIKKVREFNRYYTVWLNLINKRYLGTEFSWPESRVLFEIYICQDVNASKLCELLNMDKSYISRILRKFEKNKLLKRELVLGSKGVKKIYLTEIGKKVAKKIDLEGDKQMIEKFKNMDEETCNRLCEAMVLIEKTLRENDQKNK